MLLYLIVLLFLNKVNGEKPSNTLGLSSLLEDNVESTIENVTKIFYLPHLGLSYRISKPLSVKLEGGYGIGFGDGIAFTENTLVFNLGLLWHFHHSKISKQNPSN